MVYMTIIIGGLIITFLMHIKELLELFRDSVKFQSWFQNLK